MEIERGARGDGVALASTRSCRAMIDTLLGQEDREKIGRGLPRGVPLANKIGELPGARHDAGIVASRRTSTFKTRPGKTGCWQLQERPLYGDV